MELGFGGTPVDDVSSVDWSEMGASDEESWDLTENLEGLENDKRRDL